MHIVEPVWGMFGFLVALWQLRLRKTWANIRGAYGLRKYLVVTFPFNMNWKAQVPSNDVEAVGLHRSTLVVFYCYLLITLVWWIISMVA